MKTQLPEHFMFSQTSLENWLTCRRRFQLLYLQQLAYPAPETSDQLTFEQHMANGEQFHHLVHQHQAGIAPEVLEQHIDNEAVQVWWERYLSSGLDGLPKQREAEVQLTAPLGDYRLVAQYDLLAVEPGERVVIVDWKTAQKRPRREHLQQRMQTLLYPYLMVEGGAYYNGGQPIQPEQVEMVYWFTNFPLQPERFQYDAAQHAEVEARLGVILEAIETEQAFPRVAEDDKKRVCRFCNYRSLCWENVAAGAFVEMFEEDEPVEIDDEDVFGFDVDLDQIAEIEF